MAIFTVTGDDTLVLNGRVFNDLATEKFSNEKFEKLAYDIYERDNDD